MCLLEYFKALPNSNMAALNHLSVQRVLKLADTRKCLLKCRTFPLLQIKQLLKKEKAEESIIIFQRQSPYLRLCTYLKVTHGFTSGGNGVPIFPRIG